MGGNVHQSDKDKLKGTVYQAEKDRTISTAAGDNILIDLLKQGTITPRSATLSNHGAAPNSWDTISGNERNGKFFSQGCRGWIDKINLYLKPNNGSWADDIYLYISPYPGHPAVITKTSAFEITEETWEPDHFYIYWPYDSMFIYVKAADNGVVFANDDGTPYDKFDTADSGANWYTRTNRPWITVDMLTMPVGAIPVGGMVSVLQEYASKLKATTYEAQQLIPYEHDYIALTYTGDNLTSIVYKTGGSGGSTVATLTLAYTGAVLDSVTRT